ncbi:MAG: hypothetical protein JOZ93_18910, partial [Sinobacteraceae bacterium]|nr:hypothetical protein [Nevskiaceae bacterium]
MSDKEDALPRRGLLPRYTLKDGDTFLLADAVGDIHRGDDGLFTNDTRMLSRLELAIARQPVSLLGTSISQDNTTFIAHLTNRPLPALGEGVIPRAVIHIQRRRVLWGARLYERLIFTNFGDRKAPVPIRIAFAADFADIFEVQGHARAARGEMLPASVGNAGVRLGYLGRDGVERSSNVDFSVQPERMQADCAEFLIELERSATAELYMEVGSGAAQPSSQRFESVSRSAAIAAQERLKAGGSLETT